MKATLLALGLIFSLESFAVDMSRTENWKEVFVENNDGSLVYVGACTTHRDYEGAKILATKTLVKYFEPFEMDEATFNKKLKNVEPQLLETATHVLNGPLIDADDITITAFKSVVLPHLDLYKVDIGVGGGNGMILMFNRTLQNGVPTYQLVSNVFDGDVEFCDSLVWLK